MQTIDPTYSTAKRRSAATAKPGPTRSGRENDKLAVEAGVATAHDGSPSMESCSLWGGGGLGGRGCGSPASALCWVRVCCFLRDEGDLLLSPSFAAPSGPCDQQAYLGRSFTASRRLHERGPGILQNPAGSLCA